MYGLYHQRGPLSHLNQGQPSRIRNEPITDDVLSLRGVYFMDMNLLMLSFFFGLVGSGLFMYGKKTCRMVPLSTGVALIAAAAFMFFEIDVLTAILSAATTQYAFTIAAVGTQVGAFVLGPETIAFLQAGAIQAMVLYLTLAAGLICGYAGIRTAAQIAKRKAA